MEHEEVKKQTREILNELLTYPYAQIFDIAPAEQQLKNIYQNSENALEPLIGLMFANLMLGNRSTAVGLGEKIWGIGGELSPFFELIYSDCLLNVGEIEKAGILLQSRLNNIGENLTHFYSVMVKYALLSGNLSLLKRIGEYPDIYNQEATLFDFANNHAFNLSVKDYRAILKIITDNVGQYLCSVEYVMYKEKGVELVLYTSENVDQNNSLLEKIFEKIDGYYLSMQQPPLTDFFIKILNIKLHPAWLG